MDISNEYSHQIIGSRTGKGIRPFLFVHCAAGKPSLRNDNGYIPRSDEIEIYDLTYASDSRFGSVGGIGQFVASYGVETMADHPEGVGLDMMGYEPAWKLDADAMNALREFAAAQITEKS